MLIGFNSALGGTHSGDYAPAIVNGVNTMTISSGIFDNLFFTKDVSSFVYPLTKSWNYNTILYAKFENTMIAGNIDLALTQVSNIRIKRREINTYNWTIIADIPIVKAVDMIFERYDKFCRSKTDYEYAIVIMLNGVESGVMTSTITSDFNGLFIMGREKTFSTELNVQINPTRNRPASIINTLDGKYPIMIQSSQNNYDTFSVQCMLLPKDISGEYEKINGWKYRYAAKDFLFDGLPKVIKYEDGRAWLVNIYDNIPDDESQATYEGYTMTTFQCVETGNVYNSQDLYDAGLIDINTDYYY